ncbi:MAG: NADH-quinone oxidoreductase subunit A [Anaeromyxobacter sp. RBG_16_69_14]|nr:MAG: NADH-quinone oxidoreductase subunit A [Anaeromyxobacter sp. RBG_16_69_14]HJW75411.1 NADH-quinone oxidoreductase subunit A [Thermoleophilia bacterium]
MTPLQTYFPLAIAFIVAGALAALLVGAAALLGPRRPSAVKAAPFECGSDPIGSARERFGVKFYMVALLFIVFDVEAVFVYPWAVLLRDLGWSGYIAMAFFAFTLVIGLAYVWKKGALEMETD